jgi:hypothetical protein
MTRSGHGSGRKHWLAALAILILMMLIVPIVARFY